MEEGAAYHPVLLNWGHVYQELKAAAESSLPHASHCRAKAYKSWPVWQEEARVQGHYQDEEESTRQAKHGWF